MEGVDIAGVQLSAGKTIGIPHKRSNDKTLVAREAKEYLKELIAEFMRFMSKRTQVLESGRSASDGTS
jgi:translation initiation factor 6 (eIF-6)